jgi:hypothetical protein
MAYAVAIFGTPDGFDGQVDGAQSLVGSEGTTWFDALGFSKLQVDIGIAVWGFFKRRTRSGHIFGICKMVRARECSVDRPGAYAGAGILFSERQPCAGDAMTAVADLLDSFCTVAFGSPDRLKFKANRIRALPGTPIPTSARELGDKLASMPPTSAYARTLGSCYVQGGRLEVLRTVLECHSSFAEGGLIFRDEVD